MQNPRRKTLKPDEVGVLTDRIRQLETELDTLRRKRSQRELSTLVSYLLLITGAVALVASALYASPIPALIGLGLAFWGALLLYVRPQDYVRVRLLNSTTVSMLKTISQTIADLKISEKAMYVPPRDVTELRAGKVFIPIKDEKNPSPITENETQKGNTQRGMYLSPTGLDLVNLFESELGRDFNRVDLKYLIAELPRVIIRDLEIAEKFQMTAENKLIKVTATGSICHSTCNEVKDLPGICNSIGCPFCSSIAVALTRAIGKPLVIENCQPKEDKSVETYYRVIDE